MGNLLAVAGCFRSSLTQKCLVHASTILHVRKEIRRGTCGVKSRPFANSDNFNFHETVKKKTKINFLFRRCSKTVRSNPSNPAWEHIASNELKIIKNISLPPERDRKKKNKTKRWSLDWLPNKNQFKFIKTKRMFCVASHKNNNKECNKHFTFIVLQLT